MRPKFPLSIILAALPFVFSLNPLSAQQKPALAAQFTELADPTKDVNSDWSRVKPGLHASFGSIDRRYPKSVAPSLTIKQQEQIEGWRGERVSAQILLWSSTPLKNIQIEISDFRSDKGPVLPANIAEARFVRYVMTDEFAAGCGHRKPEDFAASLSPDMLDDLKSMDIDAKTARPVWITVNIPREAAKGNYTAKVKVKADAQKTWESSLKVEVIDQVLPPASEWSFHLDQWQHPSAVARVEGLEMWSDAHFEALKPVMQRLADAGQKVITATINKDPWNVQTYDPYADMISWTKQKNGAWHYNYQVFDRWVEFMMGLGVKDMLNCYSIVPWNNEIHYTDEATGKLVNVVAKPGTAIFEELWTPFLTDFVKHLESKGWLEITNIAMDEREREQMDAALALLKKVSPKLGVSYADNQKTYQRYPDSDDISISAQHPFSQQDLKDRKQRGLNTTFYICCSDGFPNQFTFSDPAESTYLGWYAQATGFDGMLRWAFNSWVENPLQDSRFRTWPAGDTYIVYPKGRSSIRYERMLEGIQDFEKVRIVSKALNRKAHSNELSELNKAIEKFKSVERTDHWNADLNQAKSLLNKISKSVY
ncbi:DUF4091 domain-containing protein [Sphingobacterium sp. DK4209]|uniref:DUF4091 domain-containing protein n=1 Tax=Sphingobacterium zhuxiongii TaxID=2662364 RepID=A0A5Q0QCB3_9SPHI|nr:MULTISPECIES: DUF4091 domain-containing protein [unclassified Sphingobacterium]MVZ67090.1 DUF4091 domain-containing protein [Sphingobacterium sp. DK4209]QGA26839.1 DUF4091 domain-containing protein [Sphingobacterium sp. dk4302]